MIGFGAQQLFTYASKDLEALLQEYKNYDGICEMFDNGDLDSLKPGKITTGCTVVQRKQGVNIPISKREIRPVTPDNGNNEYYNMHQIPQNMPMNHMPLSGKPVYTDMMMPAGMMNTFSMMPLPNQQPQPNSNRKRKSLPSGGWVNGIGMTEFPGLNFQGMQNLGPLRTPPGAGSNPNFTLAMGGKGNMMEDPAAGDFNNNFSSKKKIKGKDEFVGNQMGFLMADNLGLGVSSPGGNHIEPDLSDSGFYGFSKTGNVSDGGWMNMQGMSSGPSFTLGSGSSVPHPPQ
jgi:hypothetical protein